MRGSEGLVQIHVQNVEAHVAGFDLAEDGIEVGAIVVQQTARFVHDLAIVSIWRSNTPQVDGFVIIRPAVCGPTAARSASTSTSPLPSTGTSVTL